MKSLTLDYMVQVHPLALFVAMRITDKRFSFMLHLRMRRHMNKSTACSKSSAYT